MGKHFNLIVLVLILVVSAILARGFWSSGPSLQTDLKASLDLFYGNSQTEVEVTPAGDARIRVWMTGGIPPGQKRWVFPLSRFVASRHPGGQLTSLTVTDATAEEPLREAPTARGSLSDPGNAASARRELLTRSAQSDLEKLAGPGKVLALVDVTWEESVSQWLPHVPADYTRSVQKFGRRARLEGDQGAPAQHNEAAAFVPTPVRRATQQVTVCLVFNGRPSTELVQSAQENMRALTRPRTDVRVVILP